MKNKLLALLLAFTTVFSVLAGLCFAVKADSPNLLEMYGYNPNFDDGLAPWTTSSGTIEQCDEDSADDDGYCAKTTSRATNFANARLSGDEAVRLFNDQGAGTYYYSFYAKCAKKGQKVMLSPVFQLVYGGRWSTEASKAGEVIGKWPTDPGSKGFEVTGDKWTKIEVEIKVEISIDGKELYEAIIYSIQRDYNASTNAPDLLFDDVTLIKRGDYVEVTPLPEVTIPSQTRVEDVERSEKTGIGAINYHMWFETSEQWWNADNAAAAAKDTNSVQEARGLSPAKYHFHLPFWAEINTAITQSNYIVGDISKGVAEFPEYTKEIWTREMEYAIESGIDFMAYLWNYKRRPGEWSYKYHIETKGLDGKLKMAAILQAETQDLDTMANAMCEDYWYTIDGMPVVYIYDTAKVGTEAFITKIRKKLAIAQYVKNGEVGKPAYVVAMGAQTYQTAVGWSSRGFDATTWYAFSASAAATDSQKSVWDSSNILIRRVTFKKLAESALSIMKKVEKVAKEGYMSVIPTVTLGYDTTARIDNPVTWITGEGSKNNLPYGGYTADLPTAEEVTENIVDVLNYNKENGKYFRANTVLIYAWNEFNEGGWFCPTLKVDEDGVAIKDSNGNYQVNREYLDAVKKGIALYREHEAESAIYDVDGNKIKDIDLTLATEAPKKTEEPKATATSDADVPKQEEGNNSGWVLWVIIGGAVVVAAAAVVVVIVLKKKKANAQTEESAE